MCGFSGKHMHEKLIGCSRLFAWAIFELVFGFDCQLKGWLLNNFLGEERLKVFELSNSVTMTHVEEPNYNSRWWIMHITYFGNGNYFPDIITQLGLHIICGRSFQRGVLSHLLISRDIHGYKVFSEYVLRNFWGVLLYLHKTRSRCDI